MPRFVVQRSLNTADGYPFKWEDVNPPRHRLVGNGTWDAEDAADAFSKAVLNNEFERMRSSSYRVLPYDGGMTMNVAVNMEKEDHV